MTHRGAASLMLEYHRDKAVKERATRAERLQIDSLSRRFGDKGAVADVSLQIEKGAFVGVIGRSGAGKSTMLRMINRLHQSARGAPMSRHLTPRQRAASAALSVPLGRIAADVFA